MENLLHLSRGSPSGSATHATFKASGFINECTSGAAPLEINNAEAISWHADAASMDRNTVLYVILYRIAG